MDRPESQENFALQTDNFWTWIRDRASVSPHIQLSDLRDRSAGRGVVAVQALDQDVELFSIPRTSILSVAPSSIPSDCLADIDDPWLSLILTMVFEYQRGSASPWQPYFGVLPTAFDTLMFWSQDELKLLEGSAVVDKIGKRSADKNFTTRLLPILQEKAQTFNTVGISSDDLLALCHRMGSIIMAYAFDLEDPASQVTEREGEDGWEEDAVEEAALPKGMVPLADMLNADADRNNAKLFYEDDRVVMKTIKPVASGEELFNDYGPLPSADVLRRYGYVTDNYSKYDVTEVGMTVIKAQVLAQRQPKLSTSLLATRLEYAEEQGLYDDAYDMARAGSEDGQLPEELIVLLNLMTLSDAEFDRMKKKDKLPKPELSEESKKLLYSVLVHRYAAYPEETAATADETSTIPSDRRQMAEKVIRGEKQVLLEAVDMLQQSSSSGKRAANTFDEDVRQTRTANKK